MDCPVDQEPHAGQAEAADEADIGETEQSTPTVEETEYAEEAFAVQEAVSRTVSQAVAWAAVMSAQSVGDKLP